MSTGLTGAEERGGRYDVPIPGSAQSNMMLRLSEDWLPLQCHTREAVAVSGEVEVLVADHGLDTLDPAWIWIRFPVVPTTSLTDTSIDKLSRT